ncbi:SDR family NAD(P)-dependent oxidoreductase [Actinoplanes sp. L3-i22]|uniref:SDR family NAD(P)-dependent oxidoreductase n=1 Tax=Actinoplanes sp. L3-i22 TaxID=2836373 RepID=UPI001C779B5D|nr:SDR family NAD(P)-dependent oxidoreductase [Actinoplanes sp. L3-i22]BCY08209.1 short-chain dehydrogenase/reductase [Actinoplanes sp. L3-i22]
MSEPKVWLVTGSDRAPGRAVVVAAAESGARVMAAARRPDELKDLVAAFPGRVEAVALDVTNPAAARRAVRDTVDAFGRLDVVVTGAPAEDADRLRAEDADSLRAGDADGLRAEIEADLFGVVHVTEAALPVLRAGTFVQVSAGDRRTGGIAAEGFLEVRVAPLGIRVILVELGECEPVRAAEAIVRVVAADDPPRRLPLGADALAAALSAGADRIAEARKWAELSRRRGSGPS